MRFNVPNDDPVVLAWCQNQGRNLSLALRLLVQKEVKEHGIGDYFATSMTGDKPVITKNKPVKQNKPIAKKVESDASSKKPVSTPPAVNKPKESLEDMLNDDSSESNSTADDLNNFMMN